MAPPMKKQITAIQEATFSCSVPLIPCPLVHPPARRAPNAISDSATKRKCPSQRQTVTKAGAPHLWHPFVHEATSRQGRNSGASNSGEDEGELPIQFGRVVLEILELFCVFGRHGLA